MTKTTKRIATTACAVALGAMSFVAPLTFSTSASADGYLDVSNPQNIHNGGDLYEVPFANWNVNIYDTYSVGNPAPQAGGSLSIPNGLNIQPSEYENNLNINAQAGGVQLIKAFDGNAMPYEIGVRPLFNFYQYESFLPWGNFAGWSLSLYGGALESTEYYGVTYFSNCRYPVRMFANFIDLKGKEHVYTTGNEPVAIDSGFMHNILGYRDCFDVGSWIIEQINVCESRNDCIIIDEYGTFAYGYIVIQMCPQSSTGEQSLVTTMLYDTDNGYVTTRSRGVAKKLYLENQLPPIDNSNPTITIWEIAKGFFSTEFLPSFTFGHMLLIALGCVVLGIGLKVALGG